MLLRGWTRYQGLENYLKVNVIEPVVEGVTQLFFQSIILYIVIGPTADNGMVIVSLSHYLIRYIGNWRHEMILTFIP